MRRSPALKLALMLLLAGTIGCAGGRQACPPPCACTAYAVLPEALPKVEPADLSGLQTANAVQLASAMSAAQSVYRGLTPAECQCLAVEASPEGNLLASERGTVKAVGHLLHPHAAHRADVERRMLWYASLEARNGSAGDALRLYWGLAEAEQSRPLLRDSQAEVSATLGDLDELLRRGLAVPVDPTAIRMQNHALQDRGLELDLTVHRLNEQLKPALALDTSDPNWRIWPDAEVKLIVEAIDIEAAVAEGMSLRPELQMLRMLSANLDSDTLGVARHALGAINGALGSDESSCCCCKEVLRKLVVLCSDCELATRERQLAQYRADREAAVASEIRQGAFAVVTAAARVAVAEDKRSLRATNLKNLEARLPTGGANAFVVHQARIDLLDARREVIAQLMAWETARVELREAQGKLVDECRGCY